MQQSKNMGKRKRWIPPSGRMTETVCRTQIRLIIKDLKNKQLKLTGAQRFRLHERIAELQEQLRLVEIERLERQAVQDTAAGTRGNTARRKTAVRQEKGAR